VIRLICLALLDGCGAGRSVHAGAVQLGSGACFVLSGEGESDEDCFVEY
jgi:hypothetical protein